MVQPEPTKQINTGDVEGSDGTADNDVTSFRYTHNAGTDSGNSTQHEKQMRDDGGGSRRGSSQQQEKTPVKEDGKEDEEDPQQQRLRWRLIGGSFVALLAYISAMLSLNPVLSQYLLRRAAIDYLNVTNLTLHHAPCAGGENDSLQKDLNYIQEQTSMRLLYLEFCQFAPAIFVALIVGSYADYFGRKYLVLAPIAGAFLKSLVVFLVILLDGDLNFLYLGFALEGFLGSFYVLGLGLLSSIADVTISSRQRVLFFALMEICVALSGALSLIGTGYLIKALGFMVPSILVACLNLLGCVSILLFVPETLHSRPKTFILNPLVHLRKVFGFYFWDGSVSQRLLFLCGQLVLFLVTMVNLGRGTVETLFVIKSPLCWDSVQLGLFMGLKMLIQNLVGVLTLKVLAKFLRIEVMGMIGLLSGVAGFAIQSFATVDAMMYLSAAVGLWVTMVIPIVRTLLSRMVPTTSQGALFASLSAVETVCHLSASIVYNNVYMATLAAWPGTVFMLMAAILLVDFGLLILFTVMSRKFPHFQEVQAEDKDSEEEVLPSPASSHLKPSEESPPHQYYNNNAADTGDDFDEKIEFSTSL